MTPRTTSPVSRVDLAVYEDGRTGAIQVAIEYAGLGFRLLGPKFNGSGRELARQRIDARTARELELYAAKVTVDEEQAR